MAADRALVHCSKTVQTVQLDPFQLQNGPMHPATIAVCSGVRDRVLDAAETMARGEGSANLTLDAVANKAGVSKGGLLYHFPSKDALLAAMIGRHVDRIEQRCVQLRATLPGTADCAELKAWVLSVLQPDRAPVPLTDRDQRRAAMIGAGADEVIWLAPDPQRVLELSHCIAGAAAVPENDSQADMRLQVVG